MKRMIVLFGSQYKQVVRAYLDSARVQFSMYADIYTGDIRVSVPHSKGVRFLAELRRLSIPYELDL